MPLVDTLRQRITLTHTPPETRDAERSPIPSTAIVMPRYAAVEPVSTEVNDNESSKQYIDAQFTIRYNKSIENALLKGHNVEIQWEEGFYEASQVERTHNGMALKIRARARTG